MTTIKMTTGAMRIAFEAIDGLVINRTTGDARKWPGKFAYWLARMVIKLQAEYEASEKARLALAEEFGTKSADGAVFEFEVEAGKQFTARLDELMATELDLDLPQVRADAIENAEIAPAILIALDQLITEPV